MLAFAEIIKTILQSVSLFDVVFYNIKYSTSQNKNSYYRLP